VGELGPRSGEDNPAFILIPATQLVDTHCSPLIIIMSSSSPTRLGYDTKLPTGAVQCRGVLLYWPGYYRASRDLRHAEVFGWTVLADVTFNKF
jgi:hypothetical protein